MADSRWMQRVEATMGALATQSHRRPARALIISALLSAVGAYYASSLSMNADLTQLLPHSFRSVTDVERLKDRFGGIGYVTVVGQGADPEALKRFAAEVAPGLEKLQSIRFVEYRRAARFFEDHELYYLSLADLQEIERRIQARVDWERRNRNPLLVTLEEEPAPAIDFSDIEKKYAGNASTRLAGNGGDYYLGTGDSGQNMIVLLAKPSNTAADLGFAKKLLADVEAYLKTIDTSRYGPNFSWALTGTYKKKSDQQQQITRDLAVASTVAFLLLLGYLLFHFRSFVAVALTLLPVAAGLSWTYGYVALAYGQVNLLTGFLGAILGGLGVEHGIHLLGRYDSLRGEGIDGEAATREAFTHTGGAALISSVVAALTFLALAISEFRAFREFGVIAAIGMVVTLGAYVAVLPPLLGIAARLGWKPRATAAVSGHGSELARLLPRYYRVIGIAAVVFTGVLCFTMTEVRFDYDFAALEDSSLPSFQLDRVTNRILGYSQTPVIVLTDKPEMERAVVQELSRRKAALGAASSVDFIGALGDLVPPDQEAKQAILQRLAGVLAKVDPTELDAKTQDQIERGHRLVNAAPFTRSDIPEEVRRQFQGVGTSESGFVLVFPRISMSDGSKVQALAKEVSDIDLGNGVLVAAAGEAMILADILAMVTREAGPILIAACAAVLLAMWITLGKLRSAIVCMTPTVASILMLIGLMPIAGMKFNYLNILMMPVLIGVTVDAGVHLISRLSERGSHFREVYSQTGRAICGGLLTSAVGFGALLLADHPGLNSVGKLANLGFATNLVTMLLGFPALVLVAEGIVRRYRRRFKAGAQGGDTAKARDTQGAA